MSDGSTFMENGAAGLLQLRDDRARVVSCGFNDADSFFNDDFGVGGIVRRCKCGQESEIDTKRILGHRPGLSDFLSEIFGSRLCQGGKLLPLFDTR